MPLNPPIDTEPFLFDEQTLIPLDETQCGLFRAGQGSVEQIWTTRDRKVEWIGMASGRVLAHVRSAMGYPAYYPLEPAAIHRPVQAVLMDLDGTSVHSEAFWIWIIEQTTQRLLDNPRFSLEEADLPFVSGHSVSEHLGYCIRKYCPDRTVEQARQYYFEITHREMQAVLDGTGRVDAFQPMPGLKDFLLALKSAGVRIGLVTSGLYEKAWPEIYAAFKQLGMGDPRQFYDAIISAGFPMRPGETGTLGELEPKPHPWLYAETARVGLGIPFDQRHRVVGLEDSGAGVISIRLAGFAAIGMTGGNIEESGTQGFCSHVCERFDQVLKILQ